MKTLLFLYALLQLLAGCSKEDKPSVSTSAQNANCPTLEGTYKATENGKEYVLVFSTHRDGAKVSYYQSDEPPTADSYYQPADGNALNFTGEDGKPESRTLSCGTNSLVITTQSGNLPAESATFTDIGANRLRIEQDGQSGVMTKE